MTVNVARGRGSRARKAKAEPVAVETLPIGEIDQTVFSCPSCERPLALGAHRCPGCGTRLLRGVPLGKAVSFIGSGLLVGLLAGGVATIALTVSPAQIATVPGNPAVPAASTAPIATAAPLPVPSAVPVPAIPSATRSALVQALQIDVALAASIGDLQVALAAPSFDATAVSKTLRSMSANAVIGQQLTPRIEAWDQGATVGAEMTALYAAIHATAGEGLDASVRNVAAYRAAATDMVSLRAALGALDDAARTIANEHDMALPAAVP
jgi:hypothetical protein